MQEILDKARGDFERVIAVLNDDLSTVKTGRAKPSLVEKVMVEAYEGQPRMALVELATISAPDPQTLVIQPWDRSILEKIEKAISISSLQLHPVVDGDMVRISIPPLTEERRVDLVKLTKQKLESGRVLLRQARGEIRDEIEAKKGQPGVSEDDIHEGFKKLDELTDEFMKKIEEVGVAKEKELMTM
ncbi:MAG: ribosome recycling factor [Candidatus Chisholmbacteria bacterium]|nr:ribosome recycling factor [Candidatus Chisholmbacteria bacterium]